MKKLALFILILFHFNSYSQKNISIPENQITQRFYENLDSLLLKYDIEDLRKSDNQAIRIWKNNEVILLGEKALYTFHTKSDKKIIVRKKEFENKSDTETKSQLIRNSVNWKNNNGMYQIDAFPITIEQNNGNNYNVISFYKNEQLEKIIREIKKENSINEFRDKIIKNLPPGIYKIGMTTVRIDHFPQGEKSTFYKKILPELEDKLKISQDSDPTQMPLILVNDELQYFESLNSLNEDSIFDYKIIEDGIGSALYGSSGRFGVIKVITK